MAVTRTRFERLSAQDQDYYETYYPNNYPWRCHGCGVKITAGQSYCHLVGASDQGSYYWGQCCAAGFERMEG